MTKLGTWLLVPLGVLLALLLAESIFRVSGIRFSSSFYQLDLQRGWSLRPGAEGWQSSEGEAFVKVNRDGMRDRDHAVAKPAGTFRVAILGDSFIEATQLDYEKSFVPQFERALGSCAALNGRRVEALNFGCQGYGTAQEFLTLEHAAWKYQPDAVVLVFFTGNDVYNNHRDLNPTNADAAPYFVLRDGRLALQKPFEGSKPPGGFVTGVRDAWAWLVNRSRVLQTVNEAYYNARRTEQRGGGARGKELFGDAYLDWLVYLPPQHGLMDEAWEVTEKALPFVRNHVERNGARFWLVTTSNAIQVHPDPVTRERFQKHYRIEDLFYPDKRIQAVAQRERIGATILAPAMSDAALTERTHFHGFGAARGVGHWNAEGHRFAAEKAAQDFCAALK